MFKFESDIQLNEMAKNISYRTVDRKVQLSVASIYSKNKDTDAEFVTPQQKLTVDDLVQRYVMALIVAKKPCPKGKREIEQIKTFKNYAYKALSLGATINDIKRIYKINTGETTRRVSTQVHRNTESLMQNLEASYPSIDNVVADIPPSYLRAFGTNQPQDVKYSIVEKTIKSYIQKQMVACDYDLDAFADNLQDTFGQYVEDNKGKNIINVQIELNDDTCIKYIVTPDDYTLECPDDFDMRQGMQQYVYIYKNNNINLLKYISYAIYENIILPYMTHKYANTQNANKMNASQILKKYNMDGVADYYKWFNANICEILRNNVNYKLHIGYGDFNGGVDDLFYQSATGKYMMTVVLKSSMHEIKRELSMNDVLAQDPDIDDYYYRYKDSELAKWNCDSSEHVYTCEIRNLRNFAKKTFDAVKKEIDMGFLA